MKHQGLNMKNKYIIIQQVNEILPRIHNVIISTYDLFYFLNCYH